MRAESLLFADNSRRQLIRQHTAHKNQDTSLTSGITSGSQHQKPVLQTLFTVRHSQSRNGNHEWQILKNYRVSQKDIVFRNVVEFLFRNV